MSRVHGWQRGVVGACACVEVRSLFARATIRQSRTQSQDGWSTWRHPQTTRATGPVPRRATYRALPDSRQIPVRPQQKRRLKMIPRSVAHEVLSREDPHHLVVGVHHGQVADAEASKERMAPCEWAVLRRGLDGVWMGVGVEARWGWRGCRSRRHVVW